MGNLITEKTLIPLGLVLILLGGVAWLSELHSEARQNSADIAEIKLDQKGYIADMAKVSKSLGRIEGKLGIRGGAEE